MTTEFLRTALFVNLLLAGGVLAAAQAVSVSYTPPAQSAVLGSTVVDWGSLTARTTSAGQARAVFDNPTPTLEKFEVHVTTLLPGMISHPPHHHPWEEMILIKEGDVEVSINGQTHRAGPGYLIFFASNDPHNLKNAGDKPTNGRTGGGATMMPPPPNADLVSPDGTLRVL